MSYSEGMADMLAVVKRLTASGFSEAQAEAVIEAIGDVRDDLATRADLQAQSAEFRAEMQAQSAEFRGEMQALRSDMQADMQTLRADMQAEMATLRADMQAQSAALRSEMASLRSDMQSDMQALELRLTIRLGAVVGATSLVTIGVIAALIALL